MSRHINKPQSALLLGAGFVARALTPVLQKQGWDVSVTTRSGETNLKGVTCFQFNGAASTELKAAFTSADIILSSIPPLKTPSPQKNSDPSLTEFENLTPQAKWIGYLSATSVYGNRDGQWAFEGESPSPTLARGRARADAELAWIETPLARPYFQACRYLRPRKIPL